MEWLQNAAVPFKNGCIFAKPKGVVAAMETQKGQVGNSPTK